MREKRKLIPDNVFWIAVSFAIALIVLVALSVMETQGKILLITQGGN